LHTDLKNDATDELGVPGTDLSLARLERAGTPSGWHRQ